MDKKVACIVGDGFEDSEFRKPYDRLKHAGFTVDIIGAKEGQELTGKAGKETVRVECAIDDALDDLADYGMLFIPGGYSPDHLRADGRFVEFVKRFDEAGLPIAAVCHGPQLLMSAGLVQGRTLTAWETIQGDLTLAGAHVLDQEVVEDANWITSRKPDDLDAFADAMVERLEVMDADDALENRQGSEPTHPGL
jgi:protease I